jgi:putative hemolysin
MAFVTITQAEIDELDEVGPSKKKLVFFKSKPERTLSVIQIGITLVGAIAAAVGGTGAVESLEPWIIKHFSVARWMAEGLAVLVVIVPLTYFSVVFGELVPKTFALKHPLKVISFGTAILSWIDRLISPIVTFLEVSTNFLLKRFGLNNELVEDESMGEKIEIGNLPEYHQKFMQNLLSLKGCKISKAMIPWEKVSFLQFSDSEGEMREKIFQTPHSRFPVVDLDIVVGILYKKEISDSHSHELLPWQGNLHAAVKVKEHDKILEAFLKMQEKRNHLAVVEDSNGKYVGIVTIEDIIEQIVGDIDDNADYSKTSKLLSNRPHITFQKS